MNVRKWISARRNILFLGETGVGKSHYVRSLARELNKKFIHLNITNLSSELIESELFGHTRGSFSGAMQNKEGLCSVIDDGILFLDEIGELSLDLQAKLLMLLEEGEYRAIGGGEVKKFKGVLVFATNCNLSQKVNEGTFRQDLYFRINVFEFRLKALREREDLVYLVDNKINSLKPKYTSLELEKFLFEYHWPGNFRELKNVFDYLSMSSDELLTLDSLPQYIKENKTEEKEDVKNYYKALELFEIDYIKSALKKYNLNITKCSSSIGISKVTLLSKIKKYNLSDYIRSEKNLRMV